MNDEMNEQVTLLTNAGYEVSFSQSNPRRFSCDLYGPLCDHHSAVGDSPAQALAAAIPPELVTDSGPVPWTQLKAQQRDQR
jgi:hypothetical protein